MIYIMQRQYGFNINNCCIFVTDISDIPVKLIRFSLIDIPRMFLNFAATRIT